jgi:enterochelin esterase-like enzyme
MVLFRIGRAVVRSHASQLAFAILLIALCVGCSPTKSETSPAAVASLPAPSPTSTSSAAVCSLSAPPPANVTPTIQDAVKLPSIMPKLQPLRGRSQLVETTFYSAKLNQEMPILVYLPPGYFDSARSYPVLYMLGGWVGDYEEWTWWGLCDEAEFLTRNGYIQPMIIVTPEGDRSYWFNHAPVDGSDGKPYGDYIWKDVVGYIDANYRTLPQRASRAIGGLSAGGQAAFMLALTHPEVFSIAGGHSLSLRGADGSIPFFGTRNYFKQYDPAWLVENTDTWRKLTLWIDVGADDHQWGGPIHDFHALLVASHVPHDWIDTWPGDHDNNYWSAHIIDYLNWYASKLVGQ